MVNVTPAPDSPSESFLLSIHCFLPGEGILGLVLLERNNLPLSDVPSQALRVSAQLLEIVCVPSSQKGRAPLFFPFDVKMV